MPRARRTTRSVSPRLFAALILLGCLACNAAIASASNPGELYGLQYMYTYHACTGSQIEDPINVVWEGGNPSPAQVGKVLSHNGWSHNDYASPFAKIGVDSQYVHKTDGTCRRDSTQRATGSPIGNRYHVRLFSTHLLYNYVVGDAHHDKVVSSLCIGASGVWYQCNNCTQALIGGHISSSFNSGREAIKKAWPSFLRWENWGNTYEITQCNGQKKHSDGWVAILNSNIAGIAGYDPENTEEPTVSGTPQVGQTLTVHPGTWTGNPTSFVYEWCQVEPSTDSCTPIEGATGSTWVVTQGSLGKYVGVMVRPSSSDQADAVISEVVQISAASLPTATTLAASNLEVSSATINGAVDPNGQDTHYYFEYGLTTAYGQVAPAVPGTDIGSGTSTVFTSTNIAGLEQGTTYHYKIVAKNASGTAYGVDQTFTTTMDRPVAGDWNGSGSDTFGVFNEGEWCLSNQISRTAPCVYRISGWGTTTGDQPVSGDWNGDGADTFGVFNNGEWCLANQVSDEASCDYRISGQGTTAGDQPVVGDWNGDGKDTIGIFNHGEWCLYAENTSTSICEYRISGQGTTAGDQPVVGDWNGDGKDTIGIFNHGEWCLYAQNTSTSTCEYRVSGFGASAGDQPVVGDWNGNKKATIGVFNRGKWCLANENSATAPCVWETKNADKPVSADWNGDSKDTFGVFNSGEWCLANQVSAEAPCSYRISYQGTTAGDQPVVGDWNGDGKDTIGIFNHGEWCLYAENTSTSMCEYRISGQGTTAGDQPVVGDWNGDGKDTIGIFNHGEWCLYAQNTSTSTCEYRVSGWGASAGDQPVIGDWDGNGTDTFGVFNAGHWCLANQISSTAPCAFNVSGWAASAGDQPVIGDWDGNGTDTFGVFNAGHWCLANQISSTAPCAFNVSGWGS